MLGELVKTSETPVPVAAVPPFGGYGPVQSRKLPTVVLGQLGGPSLVSEALQPLLVLLVDHSLLLQVLLDHSPHFMQGGRWPRVGQVAENFVDKVAVVQSCCPLLLFRLHVSQACVHDRHEVSLLQVGVPALQ